MTRLAALLLLILGAAACGREPETASPPPPPPPPTAPARVAAPVADRIAFLRAKALWTVRADGTGAVPLVKAEFAPAEAAWSSDRSSIAFSAAVDPDANLFPRNLFTIAAAGGPPRQVTPMPRAGESVESFPKGIIRGRAMIEENGNRRPLAGVQVTAFGLKKAETSDSEGNFQTYLPVGGGWVKLKARAGDRSLIAWRFAPCLEGKVTELKDVVLAAGAEDLPSAPAWTDGGKQLLYVLRSSFVDRAPGTAATVLRRIRVDGSGDESVAAPTRGSIIAGPAVRGNDAWVKMSDGLILRFDLKTKGLAGTLIAGVSAPDALAVSPDGSLLATLRLDDTGARSIVLIREGAAETLASFPAGEPAPHALDFSPDGSRLVLDRISADGASDLWLLAIATKQVTRLLGDGSSPVWHGR